MDRKITKLLIVLFFLLIKNNTLNAQGRLIAYADFGSNNVSDGLFINTSGLFDYQFGKNKIAAGFQLGLINQSGKYFTGTYVKASREFSISDFDFEVQPFFLWLPFSENLNETDWGLVLNKNLEHFKFSLGTSFRTISFTESAKDQYDITDSKGLHENWNMMYMASYFIKPIDDDWNIGIVLSNIDHFNINQETNPGFHLNGNFNISDSFGIYAEAWYQRAGALNLSVNYYGFFIRTGIIWNIN